jgi:hypothetical protein
MKIHRPTGTKTLTKRFIVVCAALLFGAGTAHANIRCVGKVSTLALSPIGGTLQVNTGFGVHYLCSLSSVYSNVPPENCKALYAMFLSARLTGKQVAQYYSTATSCSVLGSWSAPSDQPYFIEIVD